MQVNNRSSRQEVFCYNRSSPQRCSIETSVLKNFAKFTGKYLCQSLFFDKVAGLRQIEKMQSFLLNKKKKKDLGPKLPYLGIFGLEFEKTTFHI